MKSFRSTWIVAILVSLFVGYVYVYEFKGAEQKLEAELASKRVLRATSDKLNKVVITKGENRIVLTQQSGQWQVIEPVHDIADQDKLTDWTSQLLDESYQSEVTDPGASYEDAVYGFDKPLGSIELELEGGGKQMVTLGSRPAFGDAVYLKSNNFNFVALGNRSWRDLLITRLFELRDKAIVRQALSKLIELRFDIKGRSTMTLVSEEGIWTLKEMPNWVLDQAKVKGLITALSEMKAEDVVEEDRDSPTAKKLYRGKNADLKISAAFLDGDQKNWEMEVTAVKDGKAYVSSSSQKPVYIIREADYSTLAREPSYYRNAELPFAYDSAPVQRISIDVSGNKLALVKKEGSWVQDPEDGEKLVDQSLVKDLLDKVRALRVTEFPKSIRKIPLSNKLSLSDHDGKELFSLSWSVNPIGVTKTKDSAQNKQDRYLVDTSLSEETFLMDKSAMDALPIQGIIKPKMPVAKEPGASQSPEAQ